ncbi:MAG: CxxxxCH/CxxCH domain c-type cytochrome [Myxococcota bacterium]
MTRLDTRSAWSVSALLSLCVVLSPACTCGPAAVGEDDAGHDAGGNDASVVMDAGGDAGLDDAGPGDDGGAGEDGGDDAGLVDAGEDAGVDDGGPAVVPDAGPLTCSSCHGNELNFAPPRAADGGTLRSDRAIGAHQAHVNPGTSWHRPVECTDCHRVPATIDEPGHLDAWPAELTFGAVPNAGNVSSRFDGVTCTTWCHGATLGGAAKPQPDWALGPPAVCGDCHGLPPPAPHPGSTPFGCPACHGDLFADGGVAHVNGRVDLSLACNSCHGDATSPAPPRDTQGTTSTAARTVGAHRSHLGPSSWHAELTCDECHVVPSRFDDPGHLDPSPAELFWGPTALARGATPTFNGATCSNYCHGQTMDGGTNRTPSWTRVDGTQAACGTCHGLPPAPPHPQNPQCSTCHPAVVNAARGFVDPSLHVNGHVEAQMACGSCHELPPPTGTHLLHVGTQGSRTYGSLSTAASVTSPTGYAFGCGNCHPMDAARHLSGGLADIELYNPAAPPGSLKARSPLATYTRGATVYTDDGGIPFTLGTCGNVYCHSGPAYATPNPVPRPGVDFSFAGYPISYPAFRLDVSRAWRTVTWGAPRTGCDACHGFPLRSSEPGVHAGAGQSHSFLDGAGLESGHGFNHNDAPLTCRTCHHDTVLAANATSRTAGVSQYQPVPITGWGQHVNGLPDVAFDTIDPVSSGGRAQSLAGATYSQTTSTCANVACHKAQTAVKNGHPFRPDQVNFECNACHQY